jgi:hypothetical protein
VPTLRTASFFVLVVEINALIIWASAFASIVWHGSFPRAWFIPRAEEGRDRGYEIAAMFPCVRN